MSFASHVAFFLIIGLVNMTEAARKVQSKGRKQSASDVFPLEDSGSAPVDNDLIQSELDPSDLDNLFGQCSSDPSVDIRSVFGGMFLSSSEADVFVSETREELMGTKKGRKSYVEKNRQTKLIGEISPFAAPTDQSCCKTRFDVTAPGQVMVDGQLMVAVHMNHSYQYVQEGSCVDPAAPCRDIGICTQMYKPTFMLMYDPMLADVVVPPVRYVKVDTKSHCECMNVGRILK